MKWKQTDPYVIKSDKGYKISKVFTPEPLYIAYKDKEEMGHGFDPDTAKKKCEEHFKLNRED